VAAAGCDLTVTAWFIARLRESLHPVDSEQPEKKGLGQFQ